MVTEWDQCGGIGYKGSTKCDTCLVCYILTDYFYQCIEPTNADCYRFPSSTLSPSKNWTELGGVSPVKNQEYCSAW